MKDADAKRCQLRTFDELNNPKNNSLDSYDNYIGDRSIGHMLVAPVGQNRGSEALERSNFETALKELGGESDTVQVHRFGHWAVGWHELILIDPQDTAAVKTAEDIEAALQDYPVLDDAHLSELELEEFHENWDNWLARDFHKALCNEFDLPEVLEYALEDVDGGKLYALWCELDGACRTDDADPAITAGNCHWDDIEPLIADTIKDCKAAYRRHISLTGQDPYGENMRWYWDDTVEFPWDELDRMEV